MSLEVTPDGKYCGMITCIPFLNQDGLSDVSQQKI